MAFQADHYPGEIHLYAVTLTDPTAFEPEFHVHYESRLPWVHLADELPRHAGSAPSG
ncbi:Glutathione-dependent formaldehyde-activating GFA [Sulfitobacter noctilucicola]|nr:Glutathione-dependent formaldehyde-activating GFA [Sulfitobacter noctilucicola]